MSTVLRWQKSTFSGPDDGNACVELATSPAGVHLRESDDPGELLTTTPGPLGAFIRAAKAGEFDHLTP
ncbi:DUF397 domain-containing protein [Streptomyces sp. Rer75]|uniref:DUF397 domain-containing protein n=1 Tax=Streptomyces sp. Rer75 TaxID=2750011 RepID=UPI0015CFFEBF|nr:DUF397 domain-containing protein [Streptomyces sp. Rer75]QLH23927.1 DUF397 domain-containing protein [Streptomyces sp. Rer75]